ncbi:MAG: photosynthetic complex assembly protein PuhC [Burkholderiaceae bacterium]|jgi:putative photosynthetic complex assembly protein|nr:photosynthetic complex assembly protein PuhC [Burkholderiaceae bacterium]
MSQSLSNQNLPGQHSLTGWIFVGFLSSVLLVVALLRNQGMVTPQNDAPVSWQLTLRFEDRPNGDIAVLDANNQMEIARYQGEQGFVRGTLRTLSRERMRRGLGSGPAFELIGHTDGRLTLNDPATGVRIDLESFGPTNMSSFAQLQLHAKSFQNATQE